MKELKKLGSMALAAALTVTMAVPLTAKAEVITTYERDAEGRSINYTFTNEDTKKSYSTKDYNFNYFTREDGQHSIGQLFTSKRKTVTISVDSYLEAFTVLTTRDVARFENFKSNKKDLKVKIMQKQEIIDTEKKDYDYDFEDKNLNGNRYYQDVNGEIVTVPYANWTKDLPKGTDYGAYTIRLYTRKAGNYKLSFDAKLKNGATVKKTIKVIAKDDGDPIKEVTFGGKVLTEWLRKTDLMYEPGGEDYSLQNNRLWAKGFGPNYTTAKSGKIQVTMNKDFKLKKIEVGTPGLVKDKDGILGFKDAPNSIDYHYNWKKVKNGKKIKLSKVDDAMVNAMNNENIRMDLKSFSTETVIRVTYYDKKNKTTNRLMYRINRVNK